MEKSEPSRQAIRNSPASPSPESPLRFSDLVGEVRASFEKAGFTWDKLVEGFGTASGLPDESVFNDMAIRVVEARLQAAFPWQLKRLLKSQYLQADIAANRDDDTGEVDQAQLFQDIGSTIFAQIYDLAMREYDCRYEPSKTPS